MSVGKGTRCQTSRLSFSPRTQWQKDKTDSHTLSSELCRGAMACVPMCIHTKHTMLKQRNVRGGGRVDSKSPKKPLKD